jgi:DNA-binding FrmR family transcriptional regulator
MSKKTQPADVQTARRDLILRLKRAEGQLRGIQNMVEAGADCEDIAQQLAASRKALDKAFFELLACAMAHPGFSGHPDEAPAARIQRMARTLVKLA